MQHAGSSNKTLHRSLYSAAPRRCMGLLALIIVAVFNLPAQAVIPSAIGPMQALIAILPQILAAIGVVFGAAAVAVLKPSTYKSLGRYCWAHKMLTCGTAGFFAAAIWGGSKLLGANISEARAGVPWTSFRGGPERTGSLAKSPGPVKNAKKIWDVMPSGVGVVSVDSSPTLVGNRVYFTVSGQSPTGKSGAIYCRDSDTGGNVWVYGGEDLDRPLYPIFSSPALGGGAAGNETRYLFCGEGYHVEEDSRLICLDLDPVKTGGKPKCKWTLPTTQHVESSPCIFEGSVYAGAGDDGYWCVDIESGNVKFHLESDPFYVISEGPQAEALAKLAGKTVRVSGVGRRWRFEAGKDPNVMFLDAKEFQEVPEGTTQWPAATGPAGVRKEPQRYVIGKVVLSDAPIQPAQRGSRVKIEIANSYPDAESSPIAARVKGEPRLYFGCGVGGNAVVCVNAETGKEIWKAKTAYPEFSAPTISGENVLVGLSSVTFEHVDSESTGSVICYNAIDGTVKWESKTGGGILGSIAVKDGIAYVCCLDKTMYALNLSDGKPAGAGKFVTGSPMACSPAVTDAGVFMSTIGGKVYCVSRADLSFKWSLNLTQGDKILSSPSIAGNKLYIGSNTRGFYCVGENSAASEVARKPDPWSGLGGSAAHTGVADKKGAPSVASGNKAERLSDETKLPTRAVGGPSAACGRKLYYPAQGDKPTLVCADTSDKKELWKITLGGTVRALAADDDLLYVLSDSGDGTSLSVFSTAKGESSGSPQSFPKAEQPSLTLAGNRLIVGNGANTLTTIDTSSRKALWPHNVDNAVGAPASAYGLVFIAVSAPKPQLLCLDDNSGTTLWHADLPAKPLNGPTVTGEKVFVGVAGKETDGSVVCMRVTDGGPVWTVPVEKAPASYLVANAEYVAFTVADGGVFVLSTEKGEQTHTVPLGKGGQAPALYQNTLLLGADNRVGAYDLTNSNWTWAFREQNKIGKVLAAPLLAGEAVWLNTEKQGLIAVGAKE
jgi:outer membrane protein assembly factor BamB